MVVARVGMYSSGANYFSDTNSEQLTSTSCRHSRSSWQQTQYVFRILSAASNRTATDKRDMVYATAAILGKAYEIKADYSPRTTKKTVLTLLAKRLIEVDNCPHILDYAWKFAGRGIGSYSVEKWKPSPELPTWIPDWTRVPITQHEVWGNDYSGSIEGGVFAEHDRGMGAPFVAHFVNDATISEHLILRTKGFSVCVLGERISTHVRQHGAHVVYEMVHRTSLPNSAYALGQAWSREGDELWSLHDSDFLYVLRRKVEDAYELIGRARLYEDHSEDHSFSMESVKFLRLVFIEVDALKDPESNDESMTYHHKFTTEDDNFIISKLVVYIGEKLWINIV